MNLRALLAPLSPEALHELRALLTHTLSFGTWTDDPDHPRCPLCGVQVKWSVSSTLTDEIRARCQDGTRVSRRDPGVGPACPWAGAPLARTPDGIGVRFVGEPSTAWVRELLPSSPPPGAAGGLGASDGGDLGDAA
jgi:hypothetical protein